MDRYCVVSDHWASEEVEVTVQEFKDTCRALGWPVPILVAGAGGLLAARWYTAEDGTRVYEGDPRWDRRTWLGSGANWETVLEPVARS